MGRHSLSSMECDDEEDPTDASRLPETPEEEEEGQAEREMPGTEEEEEEEEAVVSAEVEVQAAELALARVAPAPHPGESAVAGQPRSSEDEAGQRRVLEEALAVLERELRRSEARRERVERLLTLQQVGQTAPRECPAVSLQQDILSLRYEIAWKDERIEWLQTELARLQPAPTEEDD